MFDFILNWPKPLPTIFAVLLLGVGVFFLVKFCDIFVDASSSIAKKKGYSAGLFWLFGFACGVAALIVSLVIPNKNKSTEANE